MNRPEVGYGNQLPPAATEAPAQIEVLAVEEVRLVETSHRLESLSPDEDDGCGEAVDLDGAVGHPVDMIAKYRNAPGETGDPPDGDQPARTQGTAHEVDGPHLGACAALGLTGGCIHDHALNGSRIRAGLENHGPGGDRPGQDLGVRVAEQHVRRRGQSDTPVLAGAETGVGRVLDHSRTQAGGPMGGTAAAMVDDDHVAPERQRPLDGRLDHVVTVVSDEYGVDGTREGRRPGGHAAARR